MKNLEFDVVIIGAGPAGLTAAYELQKAGLRNICILEADNQVGGISRTVEHHGNRIDIGGHRFFSKSDWVMDWWNSILPIEKIQNPNMRFAYQGQERQGLPGALSASQADPVHASMLIRQRQSRIYFNGKFFDYPLKINFSTFQKLGLKKTFSFGISYIRAHLHPIKPEASLEDFFINRFGKLLYLQFFKEYTEKVWGVSCRDISADWGAQRVKSLSVGRALIHGIKSLLRIDSEQAKQTSLIESFIYPKYGPGQMWEEVAKRFVERGGTLLLRHTANCIDIESGAVRSVTVQDSDGSTKKINCAHLISTMPVKDLVSASSNYWSPDAQEIAKNLEYRDFITVGLLYKKTDLCTELTDNWIYIQEPGYKVGRIQVFNNWSPYLVADDSCVWLGLEFFCREDDDFWPMTDDQINMIAQSEVKKLQIAKSTRALDFIVLRVPKAYPGYFGDSYKKFDVLRSEVDEVSNLFLIGRNGMHRYNNQDHSMLTAREAAHQIISGEINKEKIWSINIDDEYHEEKESSTKSKASPDDADSSKAGATIEQAGTISLAR